MRDEQIDDQFDDLTEADEISAAVATEEPDSVDTAPSEWTGPRCEKCEAPLKSEVTVCRSCGWYPSLGRFLEVDPNWESVNDSSQPAAPAPQKSHLRVWFDLLPKWSYVIIASVLTIIVESVIARFTTSGSLRTTWSLLQMAAGFLAASGCHIFNFLVLAADDADVGVIDIILKPIKLWMRAFHYLPKRLWVSNLAISGVTAIVASFLIIDGIPYERLWDWGFEPPAKQELLGAVMDRVKKVESAKEQSLEEAIGDFAGEAGADEGAPAKPRLKADCVILGYQLDKEGRLNDLILGTNYLARLVYAGRVNPEMSEDERTRLLKLLKAIRTHEPLIPIESDTTKWVKPKYACRVTYDTKERGRLQGIQWDRLLGQIGPKQKK
jgi:ATP dependent DNA ligase-like protein